jgi:chorismate synthase
MSSFGTLLRVTTYGESHGKSIGCIVEGFPSGFPIEENDIQKHVSRRRPGQNALTTSRNEEDKIVVQSGIQKGVTLGTPICILIQNTDTRPEDYSFRQVPRPGHADFTYKEKYNVNSDSGGGRASARETAARVAAGGLCLTFLEHQRIFITSWVQSVNIISIPHSRLYTREEVDSLGAINKDGEILNTRCPDRETAEKICELILRSKQEGNSLGGVIRGCVQGLNGDFLAFIRDKICSLIGFAVMSIPSVKGFRVVDFENLVFEVAFKPVSTIKIPQKTVDWNGDGSVLECKGRHDPCVLPRAIPIVESMVAMSLMNSWLEFEVSRN